MTTVSHAMAGQPLQEPVPLAQAVTHRQIRQRLFAYLLPHRVNLIIGIVCGLLVGFQPLALMGLIGLFIEGLQSKSAGSVTWVCAAVVALYGVSWVLRYTQSIFLTDVSQKVGIRMRLDVFAHIQHLSLSYFHKRRTGALISTLTNDVPKLQGAAMMMQSFVATPVNAIGYLIALFYLSWKLSLCALLVVPFIALLIQQITKRMRAISGEAQERTAELNSVMEETISAPRIIKAFASEDYEVGRFERASVRAAEAVMRGVRRSARLSPTVDFVGAFGAAAALWFGGVEIAHGNMKIDALFKFIIGVSALNNTLGGIGQLRSHWEEMMGAADRIFREVLDVRSEIQDDPNAYELPTIQGHVEFDDVSFAYDKKAPLATLNHINLVIEPGQIIAIVGETGAGKSTLADLVPRFYDPTQGCIRIDGHDIRGVTLNSLRRQIGIVPQETLLFSGTIRDNIAYGKRDATDDEVQAAARAANADSFIQSLPLRYSTIIGERGTTLSGGERQRVAIARALLANPRLLILDEATSALDAATEALVQEALDILMQGRTTIIIAHRLSTIVHADKIIVLRRGGHIAEMGTHSELMRRHGIYFSLYETQKRIDDWEDGPASVSGALPGVLPAVPMNLLREV